MLVYLDVFSAFVCELKNKKVSFKVLRKERDIIIQVISHSRIILLNSTEETHLRFVLLSTTATHEIY